MKLEYKGKLKIIDNILIDTDTASIISSPDIVDHINIYVEFRDKIVQYYGVSGSIHNAFIKKFA